MSNPDASYQLRAHAREVPADGEDFGTPPPVLALVQSTVERALNEAYPDFDWSISGERLDI